jgi:choline dehydrogenase-like flavoprotein
VLVASQSVGRVFLGLGRRLFRPLFDHAEVEFGLPKEDLANLREGIKQLARIYFAAGATRVLLPTHEEWILDSPSKVGLVDAAVRSHADLTNFGSSHPQGGACITDEARHATAGRGFRVRGYENLFVCDASVFPSSVRVNPQIAIMAVAEIAARAVGGISLPAAIEEGPAHEARARRAASPAGALPETW